MKPERPIKSIKLNAKGQLVIPKWLREEYGWREGTVLELRPLAAGVMLQELPPKTRRIEELFGILKYDGPPKALQDMDDAITEEIKGAAC